MVRSALESVNIGGCLGLISEVVTTDEYEVRFLTSYKINTTRVG